MKNISILVLVVLCMCSLLIGSIPVNATVSYMDNTDVLTDLQNSVIDGQQFNVLSYPANSKGTLKLISFSEYCFSERSSVNKYYGLYLYVYNPQQLDIVESELNKLQIGTEYDADGNVTKYEKYHITLLDVTDDKLLLKLKVTDTDSILSRVIQNVDKRYYDVSGIELLIKDNRNAVEYTVGGQYIYSGYAKGCGQTTADDNTLTCEIKEIDVAVIDNIQHTFYRTWRTSPITYADQLSSVYFAVDTDIADNFDALYSIDAEAYRYLTAPIFQIKNKDTFIDTGNVKLYNSLKQQVGKQMSGDGVGLELSGSSYFYNYSPLNSISLLSWLLPYENENEYVSASSSTLLNYMSTYSANRTKDVLGKYSSDLFFDNYLWKSDVAYEGNGYLRIYIDNSGDYDFKLVGSSSLGFWDELFNNTGTVVENIKPIIKVTSKELSGLTDDTISSQFYVDMSDVSNFREFVTSCELQGKTCYLFRFANNPFYTNSVKEPLQVKGRGMWSQETVFLDFDIISLGYMTDGIVTNIPAVMSPIDIVSSLPRVPETDGPPWWVWLIVALIVLVILCLLFNPVLTAVIFVLRLLFKGVYCLLRGLWFLISSPFKLIAKAISKRKNKE